MKSDKAKNAAQARWGNPLVMLKHQPSTEK